MERIKVEGREKLRPRNLDPPVPGRGASEAGSTLSLSSVSTHAELRATKESFAAFENAVLATIEANWSFRWPTDGHMDRNGMKKSVPNQTGAKVRSKR